MIKKTYIHEAGRLHRHVLAPLLTGERLQFFLRVRAMFFFRIQVYLVIYDPGCVSLEHLLLSRHPY